MKTSVFITGGAGYVGSSLVELLLKNEYKVTVYDNLLFNNGMVLLPYIKNKDFSFIQGDIRDKKHLSKVIKNHDIIIHLAGYVGYPLCKKLGYNEVYSVNVTGTSNVVQCKGKSQYLIYSSTGSNYGAVHDVCTENTPLNPLSIYGKTKTYSEEIIYNKGISNATIFRFATAFGISPRLRLDLLINDFAYRMATEGSMVVYEADFKRTFIHVRDMCNAFLYAINNYEIYKNNIYNVGSDSLNYSKREIATIVKDIIPGSYVHYADVGEDADKRNYVVDYSKIRNTGWDTQISIEEGIKEFCNTIPLINISNPYHNMYK